MPTAVIDESLTQYFLENSQSGPSDMALGKIRTLHRSKYHYKCKCFLLFLKDLTNFIILKKNCKLLPDELVSKNLMMPFIILENMRLWRFAEAETHRLTNGKIRIWVKTMHAIIIQPWMMRYCPVVNRPTTTPSPVSRIKMFYYYLIWNARGRRM